MNLHQRIQARREELGMSRQDFADACGVTWSAVQAWENAATPSLKRLKKIAEVLNTTPEWLSGGIDVNLPISGKYAFIPLLTPPDATSPGDSDVNYHDEVGALTDDSNTYAYRRDYLAQIGVKPQDCRVFLTLDDSMALGGQLLVDRSQTTVADGRVYLLSTPIGLLVRRLYIQLDGTLRVKADRADVPEQVMPADAAKVLGRVVAFQGSL